MTLRHFSALHCPIDDDMLGFAFGQQKRVAVQPVAEDQDRTTQGSNGGLQFQKVVIAGRLAVPAGGLDHRQDAVLLGFKLTVGEAHGAKHLHTAHLKPVELVAVVHDSHLIGFRVADADGRLEDHGSLVYPRSDGVEAEQIRDCA